MLDPIGPIGLLGALHKGGQTQNKETIGNAQNRLITWTTAQKKHGYEKKLDIII